MTTALLFPGQGAQYVGMASDLFDHSEEVRDLYAFASREIGDDIADISFAGPADRLKQTRFTQPAILLHSLSILTVLRDELPDFSYAAGHSLGEYGALVAAGALSPRDAISAVVRRASLMEAACLANPGTMAAILGLTSEDVANVCRKAESAGVVVPANINASGQIVISGSHAGVERAIAIAKEAGAKRALMLEVGGAFHSPLMEPARAGMEAFLADFPIQIPTVPVIVNVTAQPVRDPEQIRQLLVEQITSAVRWAETMAHKKQAGVKRTIEIGPGKVLTGLAKRDIAPDQMINLDTMGDIELFLTPAVG